MGGDGSSSRAKSSKKERKRSRPKKKSSRKESKRRRHDSVSSYSEDDLSDSGRLAKSSRSKSGYKIRKRRQRKLVRDRSDSSYSDDHSVCSDSGSLSSIDKGYRSKKSRKRKSLSKLSKKKAKKRASSFSSDSDEHIARKRKRSDGGDRKKYKKKSKKYASNSLDSDSGSCSTCRGRSEDGNSKRRRRTTDVDKERAETSAYRDSEDPIARSPSIDRGVETHYLTAIPAGTNPRRLKSVIAVADRPDTEILTRLEKDSYKEEIVYDQEDDYPSPRSLDSDEGFGNSRFRDTGEETEIPKSMNGEDATDPEDDKGNTNHSAPVKDDMETVLRQRALENFRKFKADSQKFRVQDAKDPVSPPVDGTRILSTVSAQRVLNPAKLMQRGDPLLKRDRPVKMEAHGFPSSDEKDSKIMSQQVAKNPMKSSLVACSEKGTLKTSQVPLERAVPGGDTNAGNTAVKFSATEPSSSVAVSQEGNVEGKPKDASESKLEGKAKDSSEFEQKTMSVMRGGEMVEVSYKVYIPKRAPALARRQLRR